MNPIRKSKMLKTVSVFTAISLLTQVFFPTAAWALTSGPSSPEFSSFEPVATTNMVNTFSGDFTYNLPVVNIPGPNGSGYAMSLSYHAGENVESEASWVGYGWTLNPGAINRSKRGIADDSKAENIKYYNDVPANWTASIGASVGGIETFGKDLPISANGVFKYNNNKGFDFVKGIGISLGGMVNLGFSHVDGEGSFSVTVNPIAILKAAVNKSKKIAKKIKSKNSANDTKMFCGPPAPPTDKEIAREKRRNKIKTTSDGIMSSYISHSMSAIEMPTTVSEYKGFSINGSFSLEAVPAWIPIGAEGGLNGGYSQQKYEEVDNLTAYGYMYSGETTKTKYDLMDYYSEKESMYNKRDKYLSIPFSNADQYYLSGEGLSGGFRLHSSQPGQFSPNYKKSGMTSVNIGVEIQTVTNIGIGADVGVGYQSLEVSGDWKYNGNTTSYNFPENDGSENYFFRFNNDMGGDLRAFASTAPIRASVEDAGFDNFKPLISTSNIYTKHISSVEGVNRSGRSTYIGYHTNSEMADPINGIAYNSYEKNSSTNEHINRSSVPNGIGEFTFFNEGGNRYIYGLPVYSKNEKSINYGLKGTDFYLGDNHTVYINNDNFRTTVGQENAAPYATSYLLTEITTPDYVDRTFNGVDDSDFGGYTKFSYKQHIGTDSDASKTSGNWYKWRMPYTGLSYSAGSALFKDDDIGSVNSGEKEIYYLDTVQTKTHFAIFHTSERNDGMGAFSNDITAAENQAIMGTDTLQKLDSICVFAKPAKVGDNPKLVQKVVFDYSNKLCLGLPNSSNGGGKLTLDKVWFEHNGIVNAKINPYKFSYEYPNDNTYPSEYTDLDTLGNLIDQNPNYNPVMTDRWGNYREESSSIARDDKRMPWVDQTPPDNFDPAAWQLKAITLPSGGEIHVQYEADDYRYVQDKQATVMVSIKSVDDEDENRIKYYLNIEDDLNETDLNAYKTVIEDELKNEKIYFKFLYALLAGYDAKFNNGASDYVDGFVAFHNVDVDGDGLYIEIGPETPDPVAYQLPKNVCEDYVNHEVRGKIRAWSIPEQANVSEGDNSAVKAALFDVYDFMTKAAKLLDVATCADMNNSLSYFRIPVLHSKKGGGLRVKRILMYDKGIETGAKSLYGSEYIYKQEDGESSGVATNEPSVGRYENALIVPLEKRSNQPFYEKITSGKDKDQFEGPHGESILPSPSVGYSRVVVKNIHKGKTNTGFTVNEFNTVFDYPFDKDDYKYLGKAVDNTEVDTEKQIVRLPTGLMNTFINNYWVSQGYAFTITNMHGQPKSVKTYGGDYSNPQKMVLSSSQVFEYFEPGEKIPILYDNMVIVKDGDPGMEQEVVFEMKSVEEISNDGGVEGDVSFSVLLPIPLTFGSAWPSYTYSENKLRTHVTTKITRYPVIQKRVISMQEGIEHITENVAFSRHTGKPVVTRTYDGYHGQNLQKSTEHSGTYTNYNLPASYVYDGMSQKSNK